LSSAFLKLKITGRRGHHPDAQPPVAPTGAVDDLAENPGISSKIIIPATPPTRGRNDCSHSVNPLLIFLDSPTFVVDNTRCAAAIGWRISLGEQGQIR
jgi:hypothetical protein